MFMKYTIISIAMIFIASECYSQTMCFKYSDGSISCDGDNGSSRTVAPLGRNGGVITDERGNVTPYSNGVIIDNTSRKPEWESRSEERRRQDIYGEDRRDRNRSRYDDER